MAGLGDHSGLQEEEQLRFVPRFPEQGRGHASRSGKVTAGTQAWGRPLLRGLSRSEETAKEAGKGDKAEDAKTQHHGREGLTQSRCPESEYNKLKGGHPSQNLTVHPRLPLTQPGAGCIRSTGGGGGGFTSRPHPQRLIELYQHVLRTS